MCKITKRKRENKILATTKILEILKGKPTAIFWDQILYKKYINPHLA